MVIWLYRVLFLPALFLALPYYGFRMWRRGGYRKDFAHRWGRLRNLPPRRPDVKRIWIQAVSVGELLAIGPLMERLAASGSVEIILSTTTSTGRRLADERYGELSAWRGIFPLDWWLFSRAAWKRIQPDLVVLMESELWPEHIHQASRRGVPVMLVNARMSDRSHRRYRRLAPVARPLLRGLSAILASSEVDAKRFAALRLAATVSTAGNLKFDFDDAASRLDPTEAVALKAECGIGPEELLIVGASTWPGEEVWLTRALLRLREEGHALRLLLVPRHAERRQELKRGLIELTPRVHLRSRHPQAPEGNLVYIADSTGELRRFIQLADVAFIGKSLPPHREGQTPIEAAAYTIPTIFGPGVSNFRGITGELVDEGASIQIQAADQLESALRKLLTDPEKRRRSGSAARRVFERHRGAVERIAASIGDRLHACGRFS